MALMNCPECGGIVSEQASSCPQCGYCVDTIDKKFLRFIFFRAIPKDIITISEKPTILLSFKESRYQYYKWGAYAKSQKAIFMFTSKWGGKGSVHIHDVPETIADDYGRRTTTKKIELLLDVLEMGSKSAAKKREE